MYKLLTLFIGFALSANVFASDTYEVKFKCSATPQYTNSTYVHADSDSQALAMAREYVNSNTGYKNKGCSITEVNNQSSSFSSRSERAETRYEVMFKCSATPQYTNSTYVSASSDTQAALAAKNYFDNNTGYRNKGCAVTGIRAQ